MRYNALNQMTARNLPEGKHADGQGLWLVKSEKSRGKWVLRVVVHGKRREMGMGRWPDVSIGEARERAEEARRLARSSVDPVAARMREKRRQAPLTLKEAVQGCFEARKAELKADGEAGRWMSPLSVHVIPKLGKYPVEDISQHVIKETLEPIWHKKPEAAEKALNRINLTLKHAAALGLNVDLQATMKARALLGKQRRTTEHIPAMPYEDAPAFYQWLRTVDGVSARALRFLMLTLARTSEVRLAVPEEVQGDVWVIPPERTKTNREHRVPLVKPAKLIVEEVEGPFLFPAYKGKPMSDMAMSKFMRDHKHEARPHGFRATFRTWAEEQTDAPFELKEACLGHAVDQGVVPAYQRSDRLEKRRKLMEDWAAFLTKA
jgi:integrase